MALWYPKWSKPHTEATLSWDVSGYYWYLPAYLIYGDPVDMAFKDEIMKKYRPSGDFYQAYPHGEGFVMKYPVGLAVQFLPAFAIGHLWASLSPAYPADGFSYPYQASIHWGSILIAFFGLWIAGLVLRRLFRDEIAAVTLLLIAVGTNYLNYASTDAAMTHNYLFTLYALLIYATMRWHENPGRRSALVIGALAGLAALTRPTEAIAILIPLLWGWSGWRQRIKLFQNRWPDLLLAALAMGLVGSLQLLYWKSAAGEWLVYSYQEQGFSFLRPHVLNVFFSYKKGWLIYTPLMAFALAGFIFLWKKPGLFWPVFIFFGINAWIVSAWDIWWYGGSFGQRAMVQSYALLAFPLAAFVEWAWRRNWRKMLFIPAALFGIALNVFQTVQAHNGALDPEMMNRAYYWRIFFNPNVAPEDRLLLDSNERPFRNDTPGDTLHFPAEHFPARLDPRANSETWSIPYDGKNASGLRLHARMLCDHMEWNVWDMAQLHIAFVRNGETVKDNFIRAHRVLTPGQWTDVQADFRFPDSPFDEVRVYLLNLSHHSTVSIDALLLKAP